MDDTAAISYRVSVALLRDAIFCIHPLLRERLVSKLRAAAPSGRIYFSVVRAPRRCLEFMALVGPDASKIAKRRREARKANQGYISMMDRVEDGRG